jgi:hypothetical protein
MWLEQLRGQALVLHHKQPSFPFEYSTVQAQVARLVLLQELTG